MLIWMTSALYVYEFFEMFHAVCLFPTVPQFETLEYYAQFTFSLNSLVHDPVPNLNMLAPSWPLPRSSHYNI